MDSPTPMRPKKAHEKRRLFVVYTLTQIIVCIVAIALTNLVVGVAIATIVAAWRYPALVKSQDRWILISDEEFAADPEAQRAYAEYYEKWLAAMAS